MQNRKKKKIFLSDPVEFPCQSNLPTPVSLFVIPTKLASLVLYVIKNVLNSPYNQLAIHLAFTKSQTRTLRQGYSDRGASSSAAESTGPL